jgi:glycosyltransferase involved in cell wall biosynthesis
LKNPDISIVVPLFNEEESLPELVAWINRVFDDNKFVGEIVLIDDGSTDHSWEVIKGLSVDYKNVKAIRYKRNYGKSAALNSGFDAAQGDVIITMDADMQDSPDEIPELYNMVKNDGYDLVSGWKKKRHDPLSKTIPTKFFNSATRIMSGISLHDFNCGLKAYDKKVVKSIEVYGEMHRYIPVLAKNRGYSNIGEKVVEHRARQYGITKFGMNRFLNGFLDLMTITFVSRFSKKPMHFFGALGTLMFAIGFFVTLWLGIAKAISLYNGIPNRLITEEPLFYTALAVMIIGTQLFLAGFLAELVSRNSPDRNRYDIAEMLNL